MDDVKEETVPRKQGITKERLFVVLSILATELCERLTYYSVVANMVLFCTSILKMSSDDASVVTLVFAGNFIQLQTFKLQLMNQDLSSAPLKTVWAQVRADYILAWSGSNLFHTLMVHLFLKYFLKKELIFKKKLTDDK